MWLTKLFNEIMRTKKMSDEWRRNTLIPIYKNKGNMQNCANYSDLLNSTRDGAISEG